MIKGKRIGTVIAGTVMGLAALPLIALAAANTAGLQSFDARGVGTGAIANGQCTTPAIACAGSDVCECLTGAQTILANQGFNKGSLIFALNVDTIDVNLPVSTVGFCLPAAGFGTITSSNGKKTLLIDISGLFCPTADGAANVFNGTYNVTSGTGGKNPFTTGTGAINGSLVGTVSRAAVQGNLQP
jgi:hypothetical protein